MERYLPFPAEKGAVVELKDGRLLGVFRGTLKSYSTDRGRTWSDPVPLLAGGEQLISTGDPIGIIRLASGGLGMTYAAPATPDLFPGLGGCGRKRLEKGASALFFRRSHDEGETLGPARLVAAPGIVSWYALNDTLIQLRSGRLLWPLYGGSYSYHPANPPRVEGLDRAIGHLWAPENLWVARFFYSDDEGETWRASPDNLMLPLDGGRSNLDALHEVTAAETKEGHLVALARCAQMRAAQMFSHDGGEHWTLPELSELNSANAPVRVKRIPATGDLMVVWNQATAEEHRRFYGRCRLSAAISTTGGRTWSHFRTIHVSPGMDPADRVRDPEPPRFVRPGSATKPDDPPPQNPIRGFLRASYANFFFAGDEVFIEHDYWYRADPWSTHPVPPEWKPLTKDYERKTRSGHKLSSLPRRLHILPLKWFYEP